MSSAISDFKLMLLLYADNLVVFTETPEALQLQTDKLYNYCQKWKLLINTEKSMIVVFRKELELGEGSVKLVTGSSFPVRHSNFE